MGFLFLLSKNSVTVIDRCYRGKAVARRSMATGGRLPPTAFFRAFEPP
jgi:hypothetical protein